jgi:hypothetical protein
MPILSTIFLPFTAPDASPSQFVAGTGRFRRRAAQTAEAQTVLARVWGDRAGENRFYLIAAMSFFNRFSASEMAAKRNLP